MWNEMEWSSRGNIKIACCKKGISQYGSNTETDCSFFIVIVAWIYYVYVCLGDLYMWNRLLLLSPS